MDIMTTTIGSVEICLTPVQNQQKKKRQYLAPRPSACLVEVANQPGIILLPKEALFFRKLLTGAAISDAQLVEQPVTPEKLQSLDRQMDKIRWKLRDCGISVTVRRIHEWGYILVPELDAA